MSVDRKQLCEAVEQMQFIALQESHGPKGITAFRHLLQALRDFYDLVEPELLPGLVIVFKALDDGDELLPSTASVSISDLAQLHVSLSGQNIIELLNDGSFRLWRDLAADPRVLAQKAVVYRYEKSKEYFHVKDRVEQIPNWCPGYASLFSVPTFGELRSALERYALTSARHTGCEILRGIWHDPTKRLFVKNRIEKIMRNSLTQYLKNVLRAEVRPEQIVDTSHPVDIKVTWFLTNRLALIEIKWLGRSKNKKGRVTARYSDDRARKGAKQLADYLDQNKVQAPEQITRGFLVLFDCRRKNAGKRGPVSKVDGLHFRNEDIKFDPKYHEIRDDFERPVRMFLEPICQ